MSRFVEDLKGGCVTAAEGLRVVGTTPQQVAEVLGSVLEGGPSYLAGSLAAGLGNGGSDIDVLVFTEEEEPGDLPMMFFLDNIILDVQFFPRGSAGASCRSASSSWVPLAIGPCSEQPAPTPRLQKRLSRWITAVPLLDAAGPPVIDDEDRAPVQAGLVRGSIEAAVSLAAMARVVQPEWAPVYWNRASRQVAEAAIRGAGDVFVGDKWLARKLKRSSLPSATASALRGATTEAEYATCCDLLGVTGAAAPNLTVLEHVEGAPVVRVGSTDLTITGGRRACELPGDLSGEPVAVAAEHGAATVLSALRNGAIRIVVDDQALSEVLL